MGDSNFRAWLRRQAHAYHTRQPEEHGHVLIWLVMLVALWSSCQCMIQIDQVKTEVKQLEQKR